METTQESSGAVQDRGDNQPMGSEYLHGWRLHSLSGQRVSGFNQSHSRESLMQFPIFRLCQMPLLRTVMKGLFGFLFAAPLQIFINITEDPTASASPPG